MVGHVLVTGHFSILHGAAITHWFTPTRAAVTAIRVNHLTGPIPAVPGSDPMPANTWSDAPFCPTGFAPHLARYATETQPPAIAVALDLDLDSAEPPRARNDFEPGGLSASGDELWASDRHRPILQRRRIAEPTSPHEHLLPLPVSVYSSAGTPHVGTGGLWIEYNQTLWSVDVHHGSPARIHDLGAVGWGSAVTTGDRLVTSGRRLRRFDVHGEIDPITLPPEIASVGSLARVDEGLLVLGREPRKDDDQDDDEDVDLSHGFTRTPEPQRIRLAVYGHLGHWSVGESFGLPIPATAVGRSGKEAWVLCADLLLRFDSALTRMTVHRLPHSPIAAGPTASGLWFALDGQRVALDLLDPEAPDKWCLRELVSEIGPRGEFTRGLVVRVDDELQPVAIVLADGPRPSIAVTSDDTVWVSGQSLRGITADARLIDG